MWYTVQLLFGMWNLPGPGTEPAFPTLAGSSLTTGPPEKSLATSSSIFIRWKKPRERDANSNLLQKYGIGPLAKEAAVSREIVYSWQAEI